MDKPGLSRRERQIMDALYTLSEATVGEVMERMPDPPSYSAVRATLRVLEEKGTSSTSRTARVIFTCPQCRMTRRSPTP